MSDHFIPGKIQFYDYYLPRLSAGEYVIKAEQEIDLSQIQELSADDPKSQIYSAQRTFHVSAPRFRLAPGEVHAVYPPANSLGDYQNTLPHIVLRERTLPWARLLPDDGNQPIPWLALLLFDEAETPKLQTVTLEKIVNATNGPQIKSEIHDDLQSPTHFIEISSQLFKAIAPQKAELNLLNHVRRVDTGDKELLGLKEDGWFSVVVCNRLPKDGELNTAHLVSLEGWEDLLDNASGPAGNIRLVSLASWSFTATTGSGSFQELMKGLDKGLLRVELPETIRGQKSDGALLVQAAVGAGYIPLNYETRYAEATAGWYRGPLLPIKTPPAAKDPFESAEAALIFDPRTGLFDVSYAVAWQIGRLLALSDGNYTAALQSWRREGQRMVDRLLENLDLADRYDKNLFLGRGQLDAIDEINSRLNKIPVEALAGSENLPEDLAVEMRSIQEKLAKLQADFTGLSGEKAEISNNETETVVDFNELVDQIERYLRRLIDDVKLPHARSNQLVKKVFIDEVQNKLLLSDDAPLAVASIDKAALFGDLPILTPTALQEIEKEPDMERRAALIRQALLIEDEPTITPSISA